MAKTKPSHKLLNNPKAQGISVNIIIIAAIALIILVVLVAVFTGRFGLFSTGVREATTCNEACAALGMEKGSSADGDKLPGFKDQSGDECYCKAKNG
ncbi:hypothetical protein GOV14_04690 [Candidatus Pacearchaeota archaeon]|nr:hypothetical protein [Candidatus Pacearchaeota archaeon]